MAPNNNNAGVVHARDGYCDFMIRGNEALSNRNPEVAIKYYTKVLYGLSPGDVCALLNRSIAYVCEGYSELAVTDAYRASLAARAMRHMTEVANTRLDQIVKYIDVERLHVDGKYRWTRPEKRNIGTEWLAAPLASIVINALPGITHPVRPQDSTSARASLCRALEIRAAYRLCGALSVLGEGARMDALGLIDDIKSKFEMAQWEASCFDNLGNNIMLQVAAEVDPWEPNDISALGHDTKAARNKRMRVLKETMRARLTSGGYGDYPWDRYEPKLREPRWASRVQSWVEAHSQTCSAVIIQPEEADDTIDDLKPYVELRAKRDINPGEIILSVLSIINLTTSIPEQVHTRRHTGFVDHYYCNSCASLLVVPRNCAKKFEKRIVPSTGANLTEHSEPRSSVPSSQAPSSPQDFMFCHPTHMVPTCSAACRGLGRTFDNGICHTSIEKKLRQTHFNDIYPRSITDRNTQCLRDLIFVRLIARAINLGKNPLGINDIMFATAGPDMRDIGYEEVEHWSFTSHVVRPLLYLDDLFRKLNTDEFERLAQVDGWMLNTLLVKINRVINVSQTPRYVKYFRPDGILDTAFGPDDDRWPHVPRDPEDRPTWIASIDSLVWLIGVADPAKGETPNVTIVRREGVHVYAAKTIKAGEPLLRAGNGAECPSMAEAREITSVARAMEELERIRMEHAEKRQQRMNESAATEEPQDQSDEINDTAEEHSESRIDIEQYFDALDEERRNALNEHSTDTLEPPYQSSDVNIAAAGHGESESGIDIEQYFDALDRERAEVQEEQEDRMGDASDGEGGDEEGRAAAEGAGGTEREGGFGQGSGGGNEDAVLIGEAEDRHGDSVRHGDHGLRGE